MWNRKVRTFRSQLGESAAVVWSQGTAVYVVGDPGKSRSLLRFLLGRGLRDGELVHLLEALPGTEVLAGLLAQALGLEGEEAIAPSDPPVFQLRQIGEKLVLVNNGDTPHQETPRRPGMEEQAAHRPWPCERAVQPKAGVRQDLPGGDSRWASRPMSLEPPRARQDRRARAGHRSWTRQRDA